MPGFKTKDDLDTQFMEFCQYCGEKFTGDSREDVILESLRHCHYEQYGYPYFVVYLALLHTGFSGDRRVLGAQVENHGIDSLEPIQELRKSGVLELAHHIVHGDITFDDTILSDFYDAVIAKESSPN